MDSSKINTLAQHVLALAKEHGIKIATAESCTGGMVGAALTAIPGSSATYERGAITYSNDAKIELLDVSLTTVESRGAVSEEVAAEMALGMIANSRADLAVSVTGIAGPGGSEFKPEGRVCFGIARRGGGARASTCDFGSLGRENVRLRATEHALKLILDNLNA